MKYKKKPGKRKFMFKWLKHLFGYWLVGLRKLTAFGLALFTTPIWIFVYFILDLCTEFFRRWKKERSEDLFIENQKENK